MTRRHAKQSLRKKILSRIMSESLGSLRQKSRLVAEKLFSLGAFQKAGCICIYVSLPREVDTRPIIDKCLRLGKKVLVPSVRVPARRLDFYEIKNRKQDLRRGAYGILEPRADRARFTNIEEADLVIVPGIVFDERNHRLGRGLGFYDRFLKKLDKRVAKIGLAFSFQVVSRVPVEKHDYQLDKVITDGTR